MGQHDLSAISSKQRGSLMGGVIDRTIASSCKASLTRTVLGRSTMLLGRWGRI